MDRASFALTLGPFAPPLDALPEWRLPVPTNLAIERSALPAETPPSGWLEYDFLAEARRRDQLAIAADGVLSTCSAGPSTSPSQCTFRAADPTARRSGRAASGGAGGAPFRRLRAASCVRPRPLFGRTPGRGQAPLADRFWLALLVWATVSGQVVGALAGPGASRSWIV